MGKDRHHQHHDIHPDNLERFQAAQHVTWVSVGVNILLTLLQIVVGYFGKSQALVADGLHSLSDMISDFLVLFANRHGNRSADSTHPYGHARIETAATFILGIMLVAMGFALLWGAGIRLQDPANIQRVHPATLWIAIATLFCKEALFRYMMRVAKQLRSQMLVANAWHSRSDAASSLVVVVGIAGNLMGYTFFDLIAALIVAFMILRMGLKMAWGALSELIDTALDEEEVSAIRRTLRTTPGVRGLHDVKTRKMGDQALVDAHLLVDPKISVSEGHYIAEAARKRVLENHEVLDVMIHIDPEDDIRAKPSLNLPSRSDLVQFLEEQVDTLPAPQRIVLHYLEGKVEAEIYLDSLCCKDSEKLKAIRSQVSQFVSDNPYFQAIHLHCS